MDGTNEDTRTWLLKKQFEEYSLQFRTMWDLYIKFYTVFLTFNVAALGVTVQYISRSVRWPVVMVFILQNATSLLTAINMAYFSKQRDERVREISSDLLRGCDDASTIAARSPIPGKLTFWAGWGNASGLVLLIICWIAVLYVGGEGAGSR